MTRLRISLTSPGAANAAMDEVRAVASSLGAEGGDPLVRASALIAERELKLELSKPGTGRTYTTEFWVDDQGRLRRGKSRPPHTASARGEPPTPDSGELRASVTHVVQGGVAYAGTGLPYGRHLEHGFVARWGTQVEPRPWMRPVADLLRDILPGELAAIARVVVKERRNG